jgi:hypothetical protein
MTRSSLNVPLKLHFLQRLGSFLYPPVGEWKSAGNNNNYYLLKTFPWSNVACGSKACSNCLNSNTILSHAPYGTLAGSLTSLCLGFLAYRIRLFWWQLISTECLRKYLVGRAWWHTFVILALGRLRQEDYKIQDSLSYRARPCFNNPTPAPKTR